MDKWKSISLVITVYNEEENIFPLMERIWNVYSDNHTIEIIFVDDGSLDRTRHSITQLNDERVHLIELSKNYGQSAAMAAGIDYASGKYIVTMDGDLQNDPADIPSMINKLINEELDLVAGIRIHRKDGLFLRKIPSKIANVVIRLATKVKMKDYGCTLKVIRKDFAKRLELYGEMHRFIPFLAYMDGARIGQMNVRHRKRQFGKSKYGLNRTFKVLSDLLLMVFQKKYMNKPMHLFGFAGLVFFVVGFFINLYFLIIKLFGYDIWGKPLLLLGFMMLFVGFQFITVGILAEMLMRIYYESQKKKHYRIRNIHIIKKSEKIPG